MTGQPYVGRQPDSDAAITNKQYVDTRYGQVAVDLSYVNSAAAAAAATLVTQSYVDTRDNTKAKITAVQAADTAYIPVTQRGAASGVASLGSDGFVPSGQLPTTLVDRSSSAANVTTVLFTSKTVTTTATKEFQAATIEIADPGYPYYPLIFGSIEGYCSVQSQIRRSGGGSIGKMAVLDPSNQLWAAGIALGVYQQSQWCFNPACDPSVTPFTRPPMTGNTLLSLYISLWAGTAYTFVNDNLVFTTAIVPGV